MSPANNQEPPVSQQQLDDVLNSLEKIASMQARLDQRIDDHMRHEHKDFDELVGAWRSAKGSAKLFAWVLAAFVSIASALAAAWTWVKVNFHVVPK